MHTTRIGRRLGFRDAIWVVVASISLAVTACIASGNPQPAPSDDVEDLNSLLDQFQDAYSNERVNDLRQLFYAEAVIAYDFDQGQSQRVHELEDWLQGTEEYTFANNEYISDTLSDREIEVYRNIAYAVCNYTYIDDTETGRGVDVFTFLKMRDRWRILSLQFTGEEVTNE